MARLCIPFEIQVGVDTAGEDHVVGIGHADDCVTVEGGVRNDQGGVAAAVDREHTLVFRGAIQSGEERHG